MKKQPTFTISIPTPCHESWDAMTSADKGRFCQNCQKTVTDFYCMIDQQIISYLKTRQGNVCGRFHAEQLNREISMPVNTRRQPLAPIAALVAALTIAIPSVQAQSKAEKIHLVPAKSDITPQQTDTLTQIRGIVIDSTSRSVLPGVMIILKGEHIYTKTDTLGKFELHIPESYKDKAVTLEVRIPDDISKEFVVSGNDTGYVEIPLQIGKNEITRTMQMGAVAVITPMELTSKPTPRRRFKYKVWKLFR